MKNEFHLWELLPNALYKISINLNKDFKQEMSSKLPSNKAKAIRKLNSTNYAGQRGVQASPSRWFNWFEYNDVNMPLWAAMGLSKLAEIPLTEMEKNVTLYKQKRVPNSCGIRNPILPIRISPEFFSFSSHFCFDGSLPQDGKGAFYSQKNQEQINNFLEKAEYCFGDVPVNRSKDGKNIPNIRLPRLIGDSCKYICGFESFGTFDSRLPQNLQSISRESKLAILVSAIVDEGHFQDRYMQLQLSNKDLINDLRDICIELDYPCSPLCEKSQKGMFYFYITSVDKFHEDYLELRNKHPLISLTFKSEQLEFCVESKNFPNGEHTAKCAEERKSAIMELLKNSMTSKEVSQRTKIKPRSVRRHLLQLYKDNKINRKKEGRQYYYYSLP